MKVQIVLGGVGGQGLVSSGEVLGLAASAYENLHSTLSVAYGSETRGTFTKAEVIISDKMISYPNVPKPDVMLCLAQVAYDRYVDLFEDGTVIVYDSGSVQPRAGAKGRHIGHPLHQIAADLGEAAAMNSVGLGVMMGASGFLQKEGVLKAIAAYFSDKPHVVEVNQRAIQLGLGL